MRFDRNFFVISILLFCIEVGIALFVKDRFIRPYLGDVLAVIFVYSVVRTFCSMAPRFVAIGVLIFAVFIEFLQYIEIVEVLGLGSSKIAKTVIGTSFDREDLLAYSIGVLLVFGLDKKFGPPN